MSLYAIRMGDWVEFRQHDRPPRKVKSVMTLAKAKVREFDYEAQKYRTSTKVKKFDYFIFEGGSVLGHIKYNDCIQKFEFICNAITMTEVPPKMVPKILKELNR